MFSILDKDDSNFLDPEEFRDVIGGLMVRLCKEIDNSCCDSHAIDLEMFQSILDKDYIKALLQLIGKVLCINPLETISR